MGTFSSVIFIIIFSTIVLNLFDVVDARRCGCRRRRGCGCRCSCDCRDSRSSSSTLPPPLSPSFPSFPLSSSSPSSPSFPSSPSSLTAPSATSSSMLSSVSSLPDQMSSSLPYSRPTELPSMFATVIKFNLTYEYLILTSAKR